MDPAIEDMNLPSFARIEISLADKSLIDVSLELSRLAKKLIAIEQNAPGKLLAYHTIRAASARLRGTN